jgi:hypothetical protein
MTAEELVRTIELAGGTLELTVRLDRLCYRLPANAATLLEDLRRMKSEVIPVLRRRAFAYLSVFVGKQVWTPAGPGKLENLEDYATVLMATGEETRWYDATAVIPYA